MFSLNKIRENIKIYTLILLVVVNFSVWNGVFAQEKTGILKVVFLDVGQGDSILIEAPNGNQVLIDGGLSESILRELSKVMTFRDRSIDIVLATHPDVDHIGGLSSVFEGYDISIFVESGVGCDTSVCDALNNLVEEEGAKRILARRGMVFDLGSGVYLKVLFPDRDVSEVATNDASIIVQLIYGKTKFLLTGDSPKKIESYLVSLDKEILKSDVLKIGHHGSKTSSSEIFVGFVSPKYAIISAGASNKYGHPHQEILDILNNFEIKIKSTSELGTIIFESDGEFLNLIN